MKANFYMLNLIPIYIDLEFSIFHLAYIYVISFNCHVSYIYSIIKSHPSCIQSCDMPMAHYYFISIYLTTLLSLSDILEIHHYSRDLDLNETQIKIFSAHLEDTKFPYEYFITGQVLYDWEKNGLMISLMRSFRATVEAIYMFFFYT